MSLAPEVIDLAIIRVAQNLPPRITRAPNWRLLSETDLWKELIAAILGSAVSFAHANRAIAAIDINSLTSLIPDGGNCRGDVERCLRGVGYRFPALRAAHIAASFDAICCRYRGLRPFLEGHEDGIAARRELVGLCLGLGPKQSSFFLRNVGFAELAVIDRHLLRYLSRSQMQKPANIQSVLRYESLERQVRECAAKLCLNMTEFDVAVWVTMRATKGAFAA
jgi:N-glycosylase/DNA lyase